jgi:hypothetical protein
MKTIKHSLLFAATVITAATAFGQARLGVTGSARASVAKTADAAAVSARAAHAADRAATHTVAGSKHVVRATGTRAAAAGEKVRTAGTTATTEVTEAQKSQVSSPDVKANAGVKSRGHLHASEQGQERSSENSILNRSQTNASVNIGAQVEADGTNETIKTKDAQHPLDKSDRIKARAENKAARKAEKAESKKSRLEEEGRSKAKGSVNASENAKEHANDNSAVFGAKSAKSAEVRNRESGPSVGTKTKSRSKVKVAKN